MKLPILVKFPSHRMRSRANAYIANMKEKARCSFTQPTGHGVYEVTPEELKALQAARQPGWGRPLRFSVVRRGHDQFGRCWGSR
jgi:hypothetical protein